MHYPSNKVRALLRIGTGPMLAGFWLASKARRQAAVSGVQQAARNLRKQGAPIEVALALLARRRTT
jgi:hypothetical protein